MCSLRTPHTILSWRRESSQSIKLHDLDSTFYAPKKKSQDSPFLGTCIEFVSFKRFISNPTNMGSMNLGIRSASFLRS